jgi:glycosyltransferase involved in cell wall biosynthesis
VGEKLERALAEELAQLLGPLGFVELGPVFGLDLARLYQSAHVFLMPSTLEGFSFTMMEAMAAGAPVLTNKLSTNPEVGQDAVPYYDEGDFQTASAWLHQLLTVEAVRLEWSQRARQRASELSWSAHWSGIRSLYQRLLSKSK